MSPLAQAGFSKYDGPSFPQLRRDSGVAGGDGAQQGVGSGGGVELIFGCNIVFEQDWDAMQCRQ